MSPRRIVAGEQGLVLLAVMTAILILTILIGALVLSSMDEGIIVRRHQGGQQALFLAEAGAYRALAELRHRLTTDLDLAVAQAGPEDLRARCRAEGGWIAVVASAHETRDAWDVDPVTGEAILRLNGGASVAVLAPSGDEVGRFRAVIRVRTIPGGREPCAIDDTAASPESAWSLTYAVEAEGITPRARRAVRLSNPPDASITLRLERAAVSRWALLILKRSRAWLGDDTVIAGPAHANAPWWIAGSPAFRGPASSTAGVLHFENCGTPVDAAARQTAGVGTCPGDHPLFASDLRLTAPPVGLQAVPPNLTRAVLGLPPLGPPLAVGDIRRAVAAPGRSDIPNGLYVASDRDTLRHPDAGGPSGIYIRGDVDVFALAAETDRQVIALRIAGGGEWRVSLDPQAERMTVDGPGGLATYRGTGSGLIYVDGSIRSLAGTIHRATRLTVAARGSIIVTGDVILAARGEAPGPTAGLLGVYSELGDVLVDGSAVPGDLRIDAAMAAPLGRFGVRRAAELSGRGVLQIFGAVAAGELAPIGGLDRRAGGHRGYRLELRYDWRLAGRAPAYFPLTDRVMLAWPIPNPLYRKPLWEEIPVP